MVNLQPTLTGKTIVVRPLEQGDWDEVFSAASDPEIWAQHPATNRYQEAVFREYFKGAFESKSAFVFIDRTTNSIVGSSRYHGFDEAHSEIEIGWTFLARSHWGGTSNKEIKSLLLEHAFGFVDTVVFWVGQSNVRSRRAMEKIGGVLREGLHHRAIAGDAPHVIYEIRRSLYYKSAPPPG